jgi:5-methylthioadenosine/S-adenosylhomocysteine deaminase
MAAAASPDRLELVLDEIEDTGFQQRPRLPFDGEATGPELLLRAPAPPLSTVLGPLTLDRLTVADDPSWLDTIEHEANLPPFITTGLRGMYPG